MGSTKERPLEGIGRAGNGANEQECGDHNDILVLLFHKKLWNNQGRHQSGRGMKNIFV